MTNNNRYLVAWEHKGCERWETFEFRLMAEIRLIQLESWHITAALIDLYEQPDLMMYLLEASNTSQVN